MAIFVVDINDMYRDWLLIFMILLAAVVTGCKNRQQEAYDPKKTEADYAITFNEGEDSVHVFISFKNYDDGEGVFLPEPAAVLFDGKKLEPVDSKFAGYFYEIFLPVNNFTGNHYIIYTDVNNNESRENIRFEPLTLTTEMPDTIGDRDLELRFKGVQPADILTFVLRDTSVNHDDLVLDTRAGDSILLINNSDFKMFDDGPVQVEITRESLRTNKISGGTRTHFKMMYNIKKELYLKKSLVNLY
jgi:hypothetical protein